MDQTTLKPGSPERHIETNRILVEILEHVPGSFPVKTIIRKTAVETSAVAFNSDDVFGPKKSAQNMWILILDGTVEILLDHNPSTQTVGQWLFVPAGTERKLKANGMFKMISISTR